MAQIAARAGIHRCHQLKATWKIGLPCCSRDGHVARLQWLAQDLEYFALKLGQLIQKQHAMMCQRNFARNDHLPFASADSITFEAEQLGAETRKLQVAQMQHQLIVDALLAGEGARVEALVREHALIGVRYAPLFGLRPVLDSGGLR